MRKVKQYIVESIHDGYAFEVLLRNISGAVAISAIGCGFVFLFFGWTK